MSTGDLQKLSEILNEFLDENQAREFTSKVEQEIARKTDDKTLRTLLQTLNSLYTIKPKRREYFKKSILALVVVVHMFVVVINISAFFVLPFLYPLWMWMPVNSFILTVTFTREACPLTRLENYLRTSLGMRRIGGFIGHYVVKPARKGYKTYKLGRNHQRGTNDRNRNHAPNEKAGVV